MTILAQIAAGPKVASMPDELQKWANVQQTQQQAGMTAQQAAGQKLQNQMQQLAVLKAGSLAKLAGFPTPDGTSGMVGSAVGSQTPGAVPGAAPGTGGGAGGGTGGGDTGSSYTGAMAMERLAVPLPPKLAADVIGADNSAVALAQAHEARRQTLFAAISSAPASQFGQVMQQMLQAGWVTPQMAQDAVQHPDGRNALLQVLQTPESYFGMVATQRAHGGTSINPTGTYGPDPNALGVNRANAQAGSAGSTEGSGGFVTVSRRDPTTGNITTQMVPGADAAQFMRQGYEVNSQAMPGSKAALANAFFGQESGSGRNPATSSNGARGNMQIMPDTFKQYAQPGERIDNPEDNMRVGGRIIDDLWQKAGGDPARVAVGYFSGPDNIAPPGSPTPWKEDRADADGTRVSQYVPSVMRRLYAEGAPAPARGGAPAAPAAAPTTPVQATPVAAPAQPGAAEGGNPPAPGAERTPGQRLSDWNAGSTPTAAGPPPPGAAPVVLSPPPAAPPVAPAPGTPGAALPGTGGPGGVGVGGVTLGPGQASTLETANLNVKQGREAAVASQDTAAHSQALQQQFLQLRALAPQLATGAGGSARQAAANFMDTYLPDFANKFATALTGGKINPDSAAAGQEFVKQALQLSGSAASQANPAGGLGVASLYSSAFPGLETQPGAIKDMMNLFLINEQRQRDYAAQLSDFSSRQQADMAAGRVPEGLADFKARFNKQNPPEAYVAAAAALNGKPASQWSKGIGGWSKDNMAHINAVLGLVNRADPQAHVLGPDGNPLYPPRGQ